MRYPCVVCKKTVREKQHALECEACFKWQHRLCNTGVSLESYRLVTKGEMDIIFHCNDCVEVVRSYSELEDEITPDEQQERDASMVEALEESLGPVNQVADSKADLPEHVLNLAFHISDEESDTDDPDLTDSFTSDRPVTYEVVEGGSRRQCKKLFSSDGYAYTVKSSSDRSTLWRCSVRSKNLYCRATITQRGNNFVPGANHHVHPSDPGHAEKTKIRIEVFKAATVHATRSAGNIVKEKMKEHIGDSNLPMTASLIRAVNRQRQKHRLNEPKNLQVPRVSTSHVTKSAGNVMKEKMKDHVGESFKANLIRTVNRLRQKLRLNEQKNMKISPEFPKQQSPRNHSYSQQERVTIWTHSEKKRRADFVSRMRHQLMTQIQTDSDSDADFV